MSSAQDPFYIVREEIQESVIRTSLSLSSLRSYSCSDCQPFLPSSSRRSASVEIGNSSFVV
jgi:hypothetical protein